jgi:hypothetical protein
MLLLIGPAYGERRKPMSFEGLPHEAPKDQAKSDFERGQYPACLMPDGTWRFGANARRIADAEWGKRHLPGPQEISLPICIHVAPYPRSGAS